MGVGLKTIFDLGDDDQDNSITDLERWKIFLNNMNINYEITNNGTTIIINDTHLINHTCSCEQRLTIEFDDEQNFQHFMTSHKPYN